MVYRKAWEVQYQRDRARGQTRYVDAKPTRSRLAELTAAHVPVRALGRACGLSAGVIRGPELRRMRLSTGSRRAHVLNVGITRVV
jgi:hypothetical protein